MTDIIVEDNKGRQHVNLKLSDILNNYRRKLTRLKKRETIFPELVIPKQQEQKVSFLNDIKKYSHLFLSGQKVF